MLPLFRGEQTEIVSKDFVPFFFRSFVRSVEEDKSEIRSLNLKSRIKSSYKEETNPWNTNYDLKEDSNRLKSNIASI